jgi:uncharacterized membrane protein
MVQILKIDEFRISLLIIILFAFWITEQLYILRIIAGSVYVLFVPGYCITLAIFSTKDITSLERFILSIGLSIAVVPIIILLTNIWLGLLIRITTIFLYITAVSLLSLFIYFYHNQKFWSGITTLGFGLVSILTIIHLSDLHVRIRYILAVVAIIIAVIGLWKHKNIFSNISSKKAISEKIVSKKLRRKKSGTAKLKVKIE